MPVPSVGFFAFAAVAAFALALARPHGFGARRTILLIANLAFLGSFAQSPAQIVPFASFLVAGYVAVKLFERAKRPFAFAAAVVAFVSAFCVLKQYAFVPHALLLPFPYLAIGLSYVFFRVLHLIIDAYQGTLERRVPLVSYLNYTLNFTSLVAGPIQLYPDFVAVETAPLDLDGAAALRAIERLVVGMSKVVVLAPLFFELHEHSVRSTLAGNNRDVWASAALLSYPVYLYLNFSGYTDVVIATARFLGLRLPENFDAPFVARGFIDFWSRWHITLSSWLKTYVYSPLFIVLVRRFPSAAAEPPLGILTFFITFFLVGLWHGSTTMFVVYGLLQGLGVSANKAYQLAGTRWLGRRAYRALTDVPLYAAVSRGVTYLWLAFTLLWFAFSEAELRAFVRPLVLRDAIAIASLSLLTATLAIAGCIRAVDFVRERPTFARVLGSPVLRTVCYTLLFVVVLSVAVVFDDAAPRIVYKAF